MNRALSRIIALIVGLLLVAAIIYGFLWLKGHPGVLPGTNSGTTQSNNTEAIDSQHNGPFRLDITTQKIGGVEYTSFVVYFINNTQEELLFTCGRMFRSDEVRSILWSNSGSNDIIVSLTTGRKEVFTYAESGQWR